jgi:hypothetical protein
MPDPVFTQRRRVTALDVPPDLWEVFNLHGDKAGEVIAADAAAARAAMRVVHPGTGGFTTRSLHLLLDDVISLRDYAAVIGTEQWELLERDLLTLFKRHGWVPGTYRIQLVDSDGDEVASLTRALPLEPEYAALTYKKPATGDAPTRAYIVTLTKAYPWLGLGLAARHADVFKRHFNALISTAELTRLTGYVLPEGAERPVSPYYAVRGPDGEIPADMA